MFHSRSISGKFHLFFILALAVAVFVAPRIASANPPSVGITVDGSGNSVTFSASGNAGTYDQACTEWQICSVPPQHIQVAPESARITLTSGNQSSSETFSVEGISGYCGSCPDDPGSGPGFGGDTGSVELTVNISSLPCGGTVTASATISSDAGDADDGPISYTKTCNGYLCSNNTCSANACVTGTANCYNTQGGCNSACGIRYACGGTPNTCQTSTCAAGSPGCYTTSNCDNACGGQPPQRYACSGGTPNTCQPSSCTDGANCYTSSTCEGDCTNVNSCSITQFDFTPPSVNSGGQSTATWGSTGDADGSLQYSCSGGAQGNGTVGPNGNATFNNITSAISCSLTCTGSDEQSHSANAGVTVKRYACNPSTNLCGNSGCSGGQNCYTSSTCDGQCSASPRYSCSGSGGSCAPDPNGTYTSSTCDMQCGGTGGTVYDCLNTGVCVVDTDGWGNLYSSEAECNANCTGGCGGGGCGGDGGAMADLQARIGANTYEGSRTVPSGSSATMLWCGAGQIPCTWGLMGGSCSVKKNGAVVSAWDRVNSSGLVQGGTNTGSLTSTTTYLLTCGTQFTGIFADDFVFTVTTPTPPPTTRYSCTGTPSACRQSSCTGKNNCYTTPNCDGACPTPTPPPGGLSCTLTPIPQSGAAPFSPQLRADITSQTKSEVSTYRFYCLSSQYSGGNGTPDSPPISNDLGTATWQSDCAYPSGSWEALVEVSNGGDTGTCPASVTATGGCPGGFGYNCGACSDRVCGGTYPDPDSCNAAPECGGGGLKNLPIWKEVRPE